MRNNTDGNFICYSQRISDVFNGHSSEYFMQEDGISKSFLSAGTILLFCGIILIITVLISYLGKRIPEYVFLQRMGISKKDLKRWFYMRQQFRIWYPS